VKRGFFVSLLWAFSAYAEGLIDLQTKVQDFVLETKRIEVPGYPHAFNPSVVRWQGALWLSFRTIPDPRQSFTSYLGLIELDEEFRPVGQPQLLLTRFPFSQAPSRAEDARLLTVGESLYIVYSDNEDAEISRGGFRMYVAELEYRNGLFYLEQSEKLVRFEGEDAAVREKNWVPFDYKGTLLLAYSLQPHRILCPLRGTGACETVATSASGAPWEWGILRGGTAAVRCGSEYLAFFHSSLPMASVHSAGKQIVHYFMGAYTFQAEPPFAITRMSPEPIVGPGFYKGAYYPPYWKTVRVVFPGGILMDDAHVWVVYGREDHECWVMKLDKARLLSSLLLR
jgi:predicted GH43/DUF377 family glycosyl hydrolase